MHMEAQKEPTVRGLRLTGEKYIPAGHHVAVRHQTTVSFPMHFHSYFELEIVLDGTGTQELGGVCYELERGDVYLLTPTDYHRVVAKDGVLTLWNVVFDEQALTEGAHRARPLRTVTPHRLSKAVLSRLDRLCSLLMEECEEATPLCEGALFDSLLSTLFRALPSDARHAEGEHRGAIEKACRYLDTHFRDAPTLGEIAAHVGFHPAYFSEQFKRVTGTSYVEHLNERRIAYAKQLLSEGLRVSEACFGAGFGSLSNFQHRFRQNVGCSPREYKDKCK